MQRIFFILSDAGVDERSSADKKKSRHKPLATFHHEVEEASIVLTKYTPIQKIKALVLWNFAIHLTYSECLLRFGKPLVFQLNNAEF